MSVFKIFQYRGVLEALKLGQGQKLTKRVLFPYASSRRECKTKIQHTKSFILKRKSHTCLIEMRRMDKEQEEQTIAGLPTSPSGLPRGQTWNKGRQRTSWRDGLDSFN